MKPIETTNTDELVELLYREGEESFRTGQFQKALDSLSRCIRAPKEEQGKIYDAKSYYQIGVIYGCLEQETLSKENLLKALELCLANGFMEQAILCHISLGFLHEKLRDLEEAIAYEEKAMELLASFEEEGTFMQKVCLAYQGIMYDEMGKTAKSAELFEQLQQHIKEQSNASFGISGLNLALRVSYRKKDEEAFSHYFEKLLSLAVSETAFLESAEFYFDVCEFLAEENLLEELRCFLDHIETYVNNLPLAYMKHHIYMYEVLYMRMHGTKEQYEDAIQRLVELLPEYEAEQQRAKMYSFDYIEYLHEERKLSAKMEQKSKLDPMTGLLNKYTIEFLVEEHLKHMDPSSVAALLLIDMDHFKLINDTLGHLAGDAILADTAMVIRRFFKEDTLCGRIGGDEFMIFVKDVADMSTLLLQAEFLRQEIAKTTSERNITISIQASVGVAVTTAGFRDYASFFAAADEALYRAKKEGRNKIVVIE